LKVWCSCPARERRSDSQARGPSSPELPIPAKHRYGAGHKIVSASPYNVAQLYAMLGESIRNGKKEPALMARCGVTG
jgi:hypothetical protein